MTGIGSRIFLRPLVGADAAAFVPWTTDAEVTRTLAVGAGRGRQAQETFIEKTNASGQDALSGIVVRKTGQLIGSAGLHQIDFRHRRASFSLLIGEKRVWGKGYGTEATTLVVDYAFRELHLNRLQLHVYEYNPRGMRVYEKVGFQREGVLRHEHFYDGQYWEHGSHGDAA